MAVEVIRKMCGKEAGLLGMMFGYSKEGEAKKSETFTGTGLEGEGIDISEAFIETGLTTEPSLATEGALWFPDLMVSDPMIMLPFMLSGVMLLNLFHGAVGKPTKGQKRLSNGLKIVALAIVPLTLHLPSAMLVYWISSSTFALGQAMMLERLMPVKPPVVPCRPRNREPLPEDEMKINDGDEPKEQFRL
jgi:inner membrane protein COX18